MGYHKTRNDLTKHERCFISIKLFIINATHHVRNLSDGEQVQLIMRKIVISYRNFCYTYDYKIQKKY